MSLDFFARNIYFKLKSLFQDSVSEGNIRNKKLTLFYAAVTKFISKEEYRNYVRQLFVCTDLKPIHYRVAFGILVKLRAKLVADISDPLKANAIEQSQKEGKVFEDISSGRAILR
ncbi:hypothetical protein ACJMK2_023764 [Sinanodonta woodiana]|uniref:Uncharacterized protein n=1 Tax=Sinanodonta woodiana TaxID=1069815 RepID=A0ABD3T5A1_SINWO